MAKKIYSMKLEKQFDDAIATISSLYELMQKAEARSDYSYETMRRIGRGGLGSTKKAERAFHNLMALYRDEQQEVERYEPKPKRLPTDSMIERAANLIDRNKVIHIKQ
jgi:hypothetical protein